MLIKDCMTKKVEIGSPDMTIFDAAKAMRDGDFGALPIAKDDRLVGMITDRDITTRAVAEGKNPYEVKVSEIMTGRVLYCFDDQTLDEVSTNFGQTKVRRLPVLSRDKRLVGIISIGDLADADPKDGGEALHRVSQRSRKSEQLVLASAIQIFS